MAEISFYLNDQDRMELFEFLTKNNALLVPDKQYPKKSVEYIKDKEEFIHTIDNVTVRFFIIANEFYKQSLLLEQNRFIDSPAFFVCQRYGGPYINIALYRGHADDAVVKYKRTDLHYYPKYINIENHNEEFKISDEFKEYYNRILIFLKHKCICVKIGNSKYWISKNVIGTLNHGDK